MMFSHAGALSLRSIAPWTTLLACAGLATGDIVLSAATPGYNWVDETSSQLMSPDARYSSLARVILGLYAILLTPFATGLPARFRGGQIFTVIAVSGMWVHIVAALISAIALNDSGAGLVGGISANEIHDQAAAVMFGSTLAVVAGSAIGFRTDRRLLRLTTYATLGVLLVLGPVFVSELWTEVNGVVERVLAASFMLWLAAIAWNWSKGENALRH